MEINLPLIKVISLFGSQSLEDTFRSVENVSWGITSYTRCPTGTDIFFEITHQRGQWIHKLDVFCCQESLKSKWSAVSFSSNISLKKIIWAFWRFYMYLQFKMNIFKMQLLKNDTANLIAFNCFWSPFISSFRKSCPLWCVILIKIHFQTIFSLVGHRVRVWPARFGD